MTEKHEPLFDEDMRGLPWTSDTGKPCCLTPGDEGGVISAQADGAENRQLRDGAQVLRECEEILANPAAGALALRLALTASTRAHGSALRIAHSRGLRLGARQDE